jgi:WD40 repeat protein
VTAVAFSESGSRAATGDAAGRIVMWNLDSTDPLHPATPDDLTFDLSPRGIANLLFGEFEGQLVLAAAADDGEFVAWDALTGEQLDAFSSPDYPGDFWVSSDLAVFAGASGGTMIVSDSDGNSIDEVPLVGGDSSVVKNAAIHPSDPPSIAWVEMIEDQDGGAYGVVIRNPQNDAPLELLNPPFVSEVTNLAFSPDGSLVVAGEVDGAIWVFDVATQEVVGKMEPAPVSPPVALVFDPARSTAPFTLASAHTNGEVLLWEVFEDGGVLADRLLGHNEVITSLAFGAGGEIASGSLEGEVIWWSKDPQFVFGNLVPSSGKRHERDVAQVSFLDDDVVVSLDTAGNLLVASITDGIGEFVEGIEEGLVTGIAATADTLAVGFVDGTVSLSIDDTERTLQTTHTDPVGLVELSPDAQGLVTGSRSADGEPFDSIAVWDAATGELLSTPELPDDFDVFSALHPGGDVIWLGGRDTQGPVALRFDATSGRLLEPPLRHGTAEQIGALAEETVTSMAVTSDGNLLVTGGSDRKIHAWNLDTMRRTGGSFVGHNEAVTGLAFIEDDERLISTDLDLFVNYWDVSERLLITSFGGPSDGISDIALSPDGSTLAVASEDDFVHTWTLDANDWIERACLLAGRNMTQAEWKLYGRGSYVRHCDFPGEGGLADYGRILTTKRPIAESTAPASGNNEPTVTAAVNAPTSLDPTSEPATTATSPPATTVTPLTAEDQVVPVDTWTFELYNQEFNFDDFDVPADATRLTVSIDRTTSPDVDLFVYEPGVYVPGTDPAGPGVFCASYGDGSEESCTIDGPTPGPWTIIVFNLEASDSPPDLIDVTFTLATE